MKNIIVVGCFFGIGVFSLVSCVNQESGDSLERFEEYLSRLQEEGLQPSEMVEKTIPGLDESSLLYVFTPAEGTLHVSEEFREDVSALDSMRVVDDSLWVLTDSDGTQHAVRPVLLEPDVLAASGPKIGQKIVISGAVCDGIKSVAVVCHADGSGSSETVDEYPGGYKPNYRRVSTGTITYTYGKVGERRDYTRPGCPSGNPAAFKLLAWICTP